jgi:anaerobic magnesium-protoporphyrin IX monomethyl ester cyclase
VTDKSKKIILITPPYHCGVVESAGRWMPVAFVSLAGMARKAGWDAEIYDAMTKDHGLEEIEARIKESGADVVGVTSSTSTIVAALDVLKVAKKVNPGVITILGGVHPTFCYEELLTENPDIVDIVVRGEGEITILDLLKRIGAGEDYEDIEGLAFSRNGKMIVTPEREFIEDLDIIPMAWDLIEWEDYRYFVIPGSRLGVISSSRGCDADCTFCSQQKFWKQQWRGRDAEKVVDEIQFLRDEYDVNVVLIADEYPTKDRERWEAMLDLLIERDLGVYLLMETRVEDIVRDEDILHKYRQSGIVHVYIGVEATDQKTLDMIKKDISVEQSQQAIRLLHEHGMITETSFVLGFPDETKASIARTFKLAKLYNPDFGHFLAITPWPYANIYDEVKDYIEVRDYSKYNLIEPIIKPKNMTLGEIDDAIISCYRKFYMSKLNEIVLLKDPFKRRYLLNSMRVMMNSSFLTAKMKGLGKLPERISKVLKSLDKEGTSIPLRHRANPEADSE